MADAAHAAVCASACPPNVQCNVPATLQVPIVNISIKEYYTEKPSDIDVSIYRKLGIKYVNVQHTTGNYWIYAPALAAVVERLNLSL